MMHIHGGFKVKQNRLEWFIFQCLVCLCDVPCCTLHAEMISVFFGGGLRWCLCAVSQIWHHRSTVFCLFVFCFLFITLSALAEHLGIEFMGMNRSFLLVCRFVGLEAWACFLQLQLVSFCSWRDQTAITRWLEIDIIIILYYINAPDFRWLLRATLQVSRVLGKKVDSRSKACDVQGGIR